MQDGIRSLANHRSQWLDRPDRLMRAARHYEGATQILIRHAIMLARQVTNSQNTNTPFKKTYVSLRVKVHVNNL